MEQFLFLLSAVLLLVTFGLLVYSKKPASISVVGFSSIFSVAAGIISLSAYSGQLGLITEAIIGITFLPSISNVYFLPRGEKVIKKGFWAAVIGASLITVLWGVLLLKILK